MKYSRKGTKAFAVLVMFILTPLTLAGVLLLNRKVSLDDKKNQPGFVEFKVEAAKRKEKERQPVKKNVRQKTASSRKSLAPPPDLGTSIGGGIEMDLPEVVLKDSLTGTESILEGLDNLAMTEDTVDTNPVPLSQSPVDYPPRARAENIEGYVVLNILIGMDGMVKKITVMDSKPPSVFDESAKNAVANWRFQPATYKSRPVEMWATLPLEFKLR